MVVNLLPVANRTVFTLALIYSLSMGRILTVLVSLGPALGLLLLPCGPLSLDGLRLSWR